MTSPAAAPQNQIVQAPVEMRAAPSPPAAPADNESSRTTLPAAATQNQFVNAPVELRTAPSPPAGDSWPSVIAGLRDELHRLENESLEAPSRGKR